MLQAKYQVTEQWLSQRAEEKGIKIYCLSDYVIRKDNNPMGPATVIIGYAGMETTDIEKGIAALKAAWEI